MITGKQLDNKYRVTHGHSTFVLSIEDEMELYYLIRTDLKDKGMI